MYPNQLGESLRKTTGPRRRQPSPLPLRLSNNAKIPKRSRTKTEIESPKIKSRSLLKNMNLKQKNTKMFMKNLQDTKDDRGLSPTLMTSFRKIINNTKLLTYEEEDESKFWFRDVNKQLFEMGKVNEMEEFFLSAMTMKKGINEELGKAMGKVFFHSNFCLPVFLFRKSVCQSRLFLDDPSEGKFPFLLIERNLFGKRG